MRWVREEGLHVTLRFLGDVASAACEDLARRVGAETSGLAPFSLRLGGARVFPSPRRPRVVALDVLPAAPLEALAGAVERGVVASGLPPERRPFRPHLTLGRVRERRAALPDVTVPVTTMAEPWDVTEVVLFQSDLSSASARYTPLERIPLGAPGGSIHP